MVTVVMTGGTSGIGLVAASAMAAAPGSRVIVGARRTGPPGTETLRLDLTRLDDVRSFAENVRRTLDEVPIDALVLNAGVLCADADGRTPDGFETTFAVNHLAHFLLLRLLRRQLADGARVVLTTSGTHDPAVKVRIVRPRHADASLLAHPERDPGRHRRAGDAGQHAYTASKLCNIMTVRALMARSASDGRDVVAIGYDPGPTPGTALFQATSPVLRPPWAMFGGRLGRLVPTMSTPAAAGAGLAQVVLGDAPPPGEYYGRMTARGLAWVQPSELARDDALCDALWADSAELVGAPRDDVAPGG
ncbi:short-chain dehydrogenase/reductase SDR [Beutenbergia cavernae DSM 12333]|uniref:Short-chain dehydrogenase/reductase SDR n=1 Tax=Beutenbergia cavernae (strain ATCC BAA-8 / DSM 12333 / CCUG 43141 / JCM 11478 / NBRC 16432 / NCIMB 13614 / HKI 0122) TaxID=471853 RepID=C5C0F6_BEUC1|nr:SDR family NAD(P)-dependent oxidoreductase [Beutenbergia cavernae]ACQ81352.1 short-chain dehydrogenase/reductase SDR [Beutenbergia cavernae DSM 12333]